MTMLRTVPILTLNLAMVLLTSSCETIGGRASFAPSTYGTEALKNVLRDPMHTRRDGVASAKELQTRTLSEKDGRELLAFVRTSPHTSVKVDLLKTMSTRQMAYLKPDLLKFLSKSGNAQVTAECVATISSFIDDDDELLAFMSSLLLNSPHPNVRARSARLLSSFGKEAEGVFIQSLKKETSASAATVMCETLHKIGSEACFPILQQIANDVDRPFEPDSYLGKRANAATVRATAVVTVETIKATREI